MKQGTSYNHSRFLTAFVSSLAFLASVSQTLATPPAIINGVSNVDGAGATIDGGSGSGYFVQSGSLTLSNATLQNFNTVGGSGSGGGAALGGAIFINTGASVTLNGVSFYSNNAQGGDGGVGTTGGVLNGRLTPTASGTTGTNGDDAAAGAAFVNGGNGGNGYNGNSGTNATNGNGGKGGNGGNGSFGSPVTADTVKSAFDIVYDTYFLVKDGTNAALYTGIATEFTALGVASQAQIGNLGLPVVSVALLAPFTALAATYTGMALDEGTVATSSDAAKLAIDTAYLTAITVTNLAVGVAGNGGGGGNAGNAGKASDFFGGGTGGKGGDGGDAYATSAAMGGAAGGGGAGGTGGFGGGGGAGGDGGIGGDKPAVTTVTAAVGTDGGAGSGGVAGFGGGAGSSGTGYGVAVVDGGSGGSAYGGAIFVRTGGTLNMTGNAVLQFNNVVGGGTSTVSGSAGNAAGVDLFMMKGSSVTLNPGAGNTIVFNGGIDDDAGRSAGSSPGRGTGLTIASGLVIFNGTNTYSGQTKITGGTLQAQDGGGIATNSSINFNGNAAVANGVLQSSGDFTRSVGTYNATTGANANRVQWDADGGFAAIHGGLNVKLNNITNNPLNNAYSAALVWSSTNGFLTTGHMLVFGSESATDNVTFFNNINLNGGNRQISVTANLAQAVSFDNPTAVVANVDNAIMTGVLSNGSLTVGDATHTGTLIFTNANTYAGGTTINGGMLVLANFYNPNTSVIMTIGSLNAHGAVTVNTGATFDFSQASDQTIGTLSGGGTVDMGGNVLTVNQDADGTFSGVLENGGLGGGTGASLIKQGSAVLNLSGANTYTGTTKVKAGTLELSGSGSLLSNDVTIYTGATLKNGNGGLASDTALTNNGTVNQNANNTIASLVNTGTINGTSTLTAATYALQNGSVVNANLGTGALTANGTVALNGTSGAETVKIASGTTTLGSAERLLDTTALTIDSGATLTLGGDEKIGSLFGPGTLANAGGRLAVDSGNFTGIISGTGGLTKGSSNTLILSGGNIYSGTTQIDAGTLTLTGSLASLTVNVASGATLNDENSGLASGATVTNDGTINQNSDDTITALINTGTINNSGYKLTAASYALNDGSVINANLGTGIVTANGTVALNGTSSADTVNIASGTTTLGSAERLLDTSVVTVSSGAKLALGGAEKIGTLNGGGEASVQLGTLTVNDGTFSGVISGTDDAFGLTKVGTGLLTLSGANTYVGTTQIDNDTVNLTGSLVSPTVNVGPDAILNDMSGGLADNTVATVNGTLALTASDAIDTLLGSGSVTLDSTSVFTVNRGYFSGTISGEGSLVVADPPLVGLTLTNANTYTGGTTVNSGALLALAGEGSLSSAGAVKVNGAFDISQSNSDQTIGDLSGSGTVQIGDRQLTLGTAGDSTYSGLIETGGLGNGTTGGLVKQGSGNFTLTGTSTVPTIDVNLGKLTLAGATPNLATTTKVTVASGATLAVNNDNTIYTLTSNGGTVSGTKMLTATTYNLNNGTDIAAKLGNVSGDSTVNSNGTVKFESTVAAKYINVVTGTLTLDGNDLLSHVAVVDIATVATLSLLGGDQTINTLNGDGTLRLNNNNLFVSDKGIFNGQTTTAGGLTKTGDGTLTLSGDNTFISGTNVGSGSLVITTNGSITTGSTTVQVGANLVNNGIITNNVVNYGTYSGNGTVTGNYTGNGNTSPGNSPGVLTVLGNYIENGTLNIEIANASGPSTDNILGYDQVSVGGKTVLNPATSALIVGKPSYTVGEMATATYITNAAAIAAFQPAKGQPFTIIGGAPGSISGHFATFTNNFTKDVIFNVSTGQLIGTGLLTATTGSNLLNAFTGASSNLQSMISGMKVGDHQYAGGDLLLRLLGAPTSAAATTIANKASPEAYAGFTDYADRVTRTYADKAVNLTPLVQTGKYSVFAGYSNLDTGSASSKNQADYGLKSNGVVAGARIAFNSRLTAGLFAGFDSGSVDSTYLRSTVKGNVYGLFGEYAAKADRSLTLTASLSTASYKTDGTRTTATSTSSFHGADSAANLAAIGLRYRAFERRNFVIEPELRLTYAMAKTDGFTETNALKPLQALNVHNQNDTSVTTEAAVNARYLVTSKLSLNARLGVSYNYVDASRDVSANVVSETQTFTVKATGMGATAFNLGLGANYNITDKWSAGVSYQGSVASDAKTSTSFYLSTALGF